MCDYSVLLVIYKDEVPFCLFNLLADYLWCMDLDEGLFKNKSAFVPYELCGEGF